MLPIIFLVLWSVSVLNLNLDKWFSQPARTMNIDLVQIANALNQEVGDKLTAQAHWLASQPVQSADFYERFCQENQIEKAEIERSRRRRQDALLGFGLAPGRALQSQHPDRRRKAGSFGADAAEAGGQAARDQSSRGRLQPLVGWSGKASAVRICCCCL